jgi:small GTP-binding protein domain
LLKAESIGDLIKSETEIQRKQAIKIMSGANISKFDNWREKLVKILSNIEAKIDFPEDDLPPEILKNLKKDVKKIETEIKKTLNDNKVGEIIREGFKIAIVGPSNAGKSSLLNYLSRREVAIVSEVAGTTRDVIETHLNIDGYPVIVSDTAGIRDSKDEIEKKGIRLALKKSDDADLNIVLIEPKSVHFAGFLKDLISDKSIFVINKSDLGIDNIVNEFKKYNPIYISLKKEKNIEQLISAIKLKIKYKFKTSEEIIITRERHRQHLKKMCKPL